MLLNIEIAGSSWDKNRFSNLDDNDNLGYARSISVEIKPQEIKLWNINFGKAGLSFKDRFIESKFSSLDRIDAVEFNRYYNINNISISDQVLREAALTYLPTDELSIISKYGYLKQRDSFNSNRFYNQVKYLDNSSNQFEYEIDYVNTKNNLIACFG